MVLTTMEEVFRLAAWHWGQNQPALPPPPPPPLPPPPSVPASVRGFMQADDARRLPGNPCPSARVHAVPPPAHASRGRLRLPEVVL